MKILKTTKLLLSVYILFVACAFCAAMHNVERIDAPSAAMKKDISALVILPDSYAQSTNTRYPVLYLLHGFGGDNTSWLKIRPDLQRLATQYNMIIVCPDGATSWYWDSPKDSSLRYQTYIADELVKIIDGKYRTKPTRKARAITGFSMGGHGGLWLGINRSDIFGACGSTSGGVDIRPFPHHWDMSKSLGEYTDNKDVWDSHTVINIIHKIKERPIKIIIDCGTSDFFYFVNEKLHEKLLYNNIAHDYITRSGAHNAEYWKNSIEYQILFFAKFFAQ